MVMHLLLFDLDGTLLRSDKSISDRTLQSLKKCREQGILIGVSTSRSEKNSMNYIREVAPDILIVSGGAVVKFGDRYILVSEFSEAETEKMICTIRKFCGEDCEITVDTLENHFWNYHVDPRQQLGFAWDGSTYTDYSDFQEKALKICAEIHDPETARRLSEQLPECDCIKFVDGDWYKFTKKTATKESAILKICDECDILPDQITSFGDDLVDIGMLKLCGTGVAMGNALEEVKLAADVVIAGNDEDGIAEYLEGKYGVFVRDNI